jgi:hypothetical protein
MIYSRVMRVPMNENFPFQNPVSNPSDFSSGALIKQDWVRDFVFGVAMKLSDFITDVGRPVSYYPKLRRVTGSTNATVFLCQFMYWTGKEANGDGWIYKTSEEIGDETGLSYKEQTNAREKLRSAGILLERNARLEHQMYFKVDLNALNEKWEATAEQGVPETTNGQLADTPPVSSLNSNTETTAENTSKRVSSLSKEKLRGIEASIFGDRPTTEDDLMPELKPPAAVLEALAAGFGYNFPKYGENIAMDRTARKIADDIKGDIQRVTTFASWAKSKKRDPYWYHNKPDTLWGDWPLAFEKSKQEEVYREI